MGKRLFVMVREIFIKYGKTFPRQAIQGKIRRKAQFIIDK